MFRRVLRPRILAIIRVRIHTASWRIQLANDGGLMTAMSQPLHELE
jgi:hypothetical protein